VNNPGAKMKYEPGVLLSAAYYYYSSRTEMIPTALNPYARGGNQSDLNRSNNLTEYDIKLSTYNTVDNTLLWSTCAGSIIVLCSLKVYPHNKLLPTGRK